jgi:hypothetical protein
MSALGPEIKPTAKQREWLDTDLLHSSPAARFCQYAGKDGVQLEHPLGGPLTWIRCPLKNAVGVVRNAGKWHWLVADNDGAAPAQHVDEILTANGLVKL